MDRFLLAVPKAEHEMAAIDFAKEIMQVDGDGIHGGSELYTTQPYENWLERVALCAAGNPPPNFSGADTYFAIRCSDYKIIGVINIRHRLDSKFMHLYGGHIGYTVRPSERDKGYAKQMLRLALNRCKELDMERVLLTCDPINVASCRVIEACGGIIENEVHYLNTEEVIRRYWIELNRI